MNCRGVSGTPELVLPDCQRLVDDTVGWLAALNAAVILFSDYDLVPEAELRLALNAHADYLAEVTGAVLAAVVVPHVAVVVHASIVLTVLGHLGNALWTAVI